MACVLWGYVQDRDRSVDRCDGESVATIPPLRGERSR